MSSAVVCPRLISRASDARASFQSGTTVYGETDKCDGCLLDAEPADDSQFDHLDPPRIPATQLRESSSLRCRDVMGIA